MNLWSVADAEVPEHLPQLNGGLFLIDGGVETTLIFHDGLELPYFAGFHLLKDKAGSDALRKYFRMRSSPPRMDGIHFGKSDLARQRGLGRQAWLFGGLCRSDRNHQDGRIVAEHPRSFGGGETVYDPGIICRCSPARPAHYATARPSRTGCFRPRWSACDASVAGADAGNRQMVDILSAVLTDGLSAVEAACIEAIAHRVHSVSAIALRQSLFSRLRR